MGYYSEAIVRHIVTHVASEGKEEYKKFFNSALKKFGVKSPAELDGDKKKEFFNYIDNGYKAKNESTKEYEKSLEKIAKDRKMKMLSKKDKETLLKIAQMMKSANEGKLSSKVKKAIMIAIKMSGDMTGAVDKIEKLAKGLSDDDQVAAALRLANENINEVSKSKLKKMIKMAKKSGAKGYDIVKSIADDLGVSPDEVVSDMERYRWTNQTESLDGDEQNAYQEAIKNFLDAALKKAGIKVKKHKPMKKGWLGNKIYGCFYTVKSASKDDVMPFTVDKKGRIDLGVSSDDWIIGKYGEMNRVVKNLKMYKEDDLDVREAKVMKEAIKDSDVILARSMWTEKERDVQKALAKDRKVAKHIGKDDIEVYFDDNELVAGGDSGNTIVVVKDGWTLGDLKKAILKKNPKIWKESVNESFRVKHDRGGPTKKTKALYDDVLEKIFKKVERSGGGYVENASEASFPHPTEYGVKIQLARKQKSGKHRDWLFVMIEKKTGDITVMPKQRKKFDAGSIKNVNKTAKIITDWSDENLYFGESVNEAYGDLNDDGFKKVEKYNKIAIKLVKKLENAVRHSEGKDAVKWIKGLYDATGIMYDTIGHKMYYESVNESDFSVKVDAYQDAMNALDTYVDVLKDLGLKKKSKLALALLKKLQQSFFAKENMDPKLKEVSSPLVKKLDHAIEDVEDLIDAANSDEADDAFEKPKPSKKALIATMKLLNKVK